ncbi:hypothetical protein [Streptomyces sp. KAU_LT]|uniref:hypothetical protein n=1 Tax=Streptomyces sp. KAU_LT TaxID=3046669 RepID=UPI0024B87710|nr:hypothetical protein [Streptomyces sp. KAU_LT]MDI9832223.1 hypothetical protein [Streptomyces sp. KAU_LT]
MDEQESERTGRGGAPNTPVTPVTPDAPDSAAGPEPADATRAPEAGAGPTGPRTEPTGPAPATGPRPTEPGPGPAKPGPAKPGPAGPGTPHDSDDSLAPEGPEGPERPERPDDTSARDAGDGTGDTVARTKEEEAAAEKQRAATASQVHHNNVNQYFLGALNSSEMHFGIGAADSAHARRRAVGRLDAGEADAVLASYVEPDCFDDAVTALRRDGVVALVGPSGTGKRAAAVALVATVAGGSDYVVLSPGRSLEELANGRVEFTEGVGYVLLDRMREGSTATADFDWRRVRDTVREHGAHLVVTTVHEVQGRAPDAVRHVPWRAPDPAAVLRVRLVRARCAPETVERAVDLMPAGCRTAEVVAAAERIGAGAEPDVVWKEYGSNAAAPVREWFAAERTPQEWAEVTTLAFVTGAGFRDVETCQQRLERHVAHAFAEPTDEEAAEAARRAADRRLSLARNTLVTVEERENGALTRTALVFAHQQYRAWVLRELWTMRSTAYWDGVRDWLTGLLRDGRADLEMQLSIAQGLALLTPSAFEEVVQNYLHPWASGVAGPAGQSTATLVLHCMCLDESLAAVALGVARDWARSPDPLVRSTAAAAFSGQLGVRFPTDAVHTLLRLTGRGGGAAFALAGLVAVLAECRQDTGAVFRPLAYRLRAQRDLLAGRAKEGVLDAALTVLRARDARTGRPVCADVLVHSPGQTEKVGELWAGVLGNLPRWRRAVDGLYATVAALPSACDDPDPVAVRLGRAVGTTLRPDERPALTAGLEAAVRRAERTGPAPAHLIHLFVDAVLSTED